MDKSKFKYWVYPVIWMALIFIGSSFPIAPNVITSIDYSDKAAHFIEYGILGALFYRALKNTLNPPKKFFTAVILATIFTSIYGVSDEIHQLFVPNREFSVFDMITDAFGGLAFSLIMYYRDIRRSRG